MHTADPIARRGCAMARAGVIAAAAIAVLVTACGTGSGTAPRAHRPAGWWPVSAAPVTCQSAVRPDDPDAAFLDIAATGPADAWAVGVCGADGGTHDFEGQTPTGFVEHWDGRRWSRVTVPASGEYDVIQAISPRDVWVASVAGDPWVTAQAGSLAAMPGGAGLIHWDGSTWAVAEQGIAG